MALHPKQSGSNSPNTPGRKSPLVSNPNIKSMHKVKDNHIPMLTCFDLHCLWRCWSVAYGTLSVSFEALLFLLIVLLVSDLCVQEMNANTFACRELFSHMFSQFSSSGN